MIALHLPAGGASALPLSLISQAIPRLSRHDLAALTERLIDRLDEIDGDPDFEEDNEDRCAAGDDAVRSGPVIVGPHYPFPIGNDDDAEGDVTA